MGRRCVRRVKKRRSSSRTRSRVSSGRAAPRPGATVDRSRRGSGRPPPASSAPSPSSTKPRVTISGGARGAPGLLSRTTTGTTIPSATAGGDRARTTSSTPAPPERSSSTRPAAMRGLAPRAVAEGQHVAVLGQQHAVRGQARPRREPRVLREHPVLAVDGHQVPRPHQAQQLEQVFAAAVAGDVNAGGARMHHVAAAAEQVADQPRDDALVAGDRARREHHGVARADGHVAVLVEADHRERRERLALAAGDEHERARGERVAERRRARARVGAAELQQARDRARSRCCRACAGRGSRPAGRLGGEPGHASGCAGSRSRSRRPARARACARAPPRRRGPRRPRPACARAAPRWCCRRAAPARRARPTPRAPRRRCALRACACGVDLEVAAREHDAGRRLDRQRQAVDDAVRDADRVHAEGPDLDGLAGPQRPQLGARRRAPAAAAARSRA